MTENDETIWRNEVVIDLWAYYRLLVIDSDKIIDC